MVESGKPMNSDFGINLCCKERIPIGKKDFNDSPDS